MKKDLLGTTHGSWVVIEELPSPDHNRRVRLECTLCYRTKDVYTSSLVYVAAHHKCQRPPMPKGTDAEIDLQLKARGREASQRRKEALSHKKAVAQLNAVKNLAKLNLKHAERALQEAKTAYETTKQAWKYAKELQNEHARSILQGTKPPPDPVQEGDA